MENKATILIAEDEASAAFALEKYFLNAGYKVIKAFSSEEALRATLENHPDVVILDVIMPSSSGLDILPELRADPWGKDARIIVFSNLSGDEYKAQARKYNINTYLLKTDTSLEQLENTVKQFLPKNVN